MFPETAQWEGNRNNTTLIHELSDKSSCLASVTVYFSRGSQLWLVNPSSSAFCTTSLSLTQAQWLELLLLCFNQWQKIIKLSKTLTSVHVLLPTPTILMQQIALFSTSRHLGLGIVTIGASQPHLACLHVCTPAFKKSILFVYSGSTLHNYKQDTFQMGSLFKALLFISTSLTIWSLQLIDRPSLKGFFSKNWIIEIANTLYTNACTRWIRLTATFLAAAQSIQIIFLHVSRRISFSDSNFNKWK